MTSQKLRRASIHIGGIFASREPAVVRTVLGSCVAACLYDPGSGVGGMNHFMLPFTLDQEAEASRYGVHAMELLINKIMGLGGARHRLRAKAFGGADLLGFGGIKVGTKNVAFVREFLRIEGIPLAAHRLGGTQALAVHFLTSTAKALVKPVRASVLGVLAQHEERFVERIVHAPEADSSDDVTLF